MNLREPMNCQIAKKAANYGHHLFVVTQYTKMVPPSVRGNCTALIAFNQGKKNAAIIEEDFNRANITADRVARLQRLEYFYSLDVNDPGKLYRVQIPT